MIDGFVVDRLIGSGGFSDVFLFEQQSPRRRVAVKTLLPADLSHRQRAAFSAEADVMARLSTHPYIVTIHQTGVAHDGRPYLVMEYCSRPSLSERYKRRPLSVVDALRVGIRLAGAVATAHSFGILHGDIKPSNVLTNDYGWPALADFGIASDVAAARRPAGVDAATETDETIGISVPWAPPEMFVDVPMPDVRSDVFSLAATIHTVLAGRTPFEVAGGPNGTADLIARIQRGQLTPIWREDVPSSLSAALAKAMSPRRDDRFSSAVEFARALQQVERELGAEPTAIEVPVDEGIGSEVGGDAGGNGELDATGGGGAGPSGATLEASAPRIPVVPTTRRRIAVAVLVAVLAVLSIGAVVLAVDLGAAALLR
ncbi:serine/threonine-protein kinase [Lysinimonas soli]|uniref:non-specific serine/threonine protein kinase n=1 Tax=Lysinimonas soli TaxID=1074233 RepID=A0ABW0NRQ9_9MICO